MRENNYWNNYNRNWDYMKKSELFINIYIYIYKYKYK